LFLNILLIFATVNDSEMKKTWMISIGLMAISAYVMADDGQFTVATLNVDGLPKTILNIPTNPDGPGTAGTYLVSKYLAQKGYDMIGVQEDFNYDEELRSSLESEYDYSAWQGDIDLSFDKVMKVLAGDRFDTDGLRLFWRKRHTLESEEAVVWNDSYGRFDHCWDAMVRKGFRYCEMTLSGGQRIVVYNMHMDASTDADEASGNDQGDMNARRSQWRQLCEFVTTHLDNRPVILMGDMNSLYPRDSIQALFIDPINASGRYFASDTWVEFERQGQYPAVGSGDRHVAYAAGEALDKIIYINPTDGPQLRLQSYQLMRDYTLEDGTPMGDHYPVTATFRYVSDTASGIGHVESEEERQQIWSLDGRRQSQLRKGMNIVRLKDGKVRKVISR